MKSITGIAGQGNLDVEVQPGVTSSVDLEGGTGAADLDYYGTAAAYLKAGEEDSDLVVDGPGNSTFVGGPGNDMIQLGSGGTSVTGGAGANTVIITTPFDGRRFNCRWNRSGKYRGRGFGDRGRNPSAPHRAILARSI